MIGTPGFNPSTNTLPLTGSTLTLTSTAAQFFLYYDASHAARYFVASDGSVNEDQLFQSSGTNGVDFQWKYQGSAVMSLQLTNFWLRAAFACFVCGDNTATVNRVKFAVYSQPGLSGSGIGCPAAQQVSIVTNDLDRVIFSNTLATFGVPIVVLGAASPVLTTTTTVTTGAGALVGTLTNSPATGNPTKWIPFNDAGTTRYIPAW